MIKETQKRVLLINTPFTLVSQRFSDISDLKMPIGLLYIASSLKSQNHSVKIIDAAGLGMGVSHILSEISSFKPDIVGLTSVAATKGIVFELADLIKEEIIPSPQVVVGGVQATLQPQEFISKKSIDYVVVGEGDISICAICSSTSTDDIKFPGIYFRNNLGEIVCSGPPKRISDIDSLPHPSYELLPLEHYFQKNRELCLIASRGCVYNCTFCCSPNVWGKKVIFRDPKNVVADIKTFRDRYFIQNFHFLDDNFTGWESGLIEFCEKIDHLKISWRCIGRIDHLDKNIFLLMNKSGCSSISFGIESGNQKFQKITKKNIDLTALPHRIRFLSSLGMKTKAFFMIGFPGEDLENIRESILFSLLLKDNGLTDVAFLPLIPYYGTEIYKELSDNDKLEMLGEATGTIDWFGELPIISKRLKKYRTFPVISANNKYSGLQLRLMASLAYKYFYEGLDTKKLYSHLNNIISCA